MKTKRRTTYRKRKGQRRYSKNKRGGFLGSLFSWNSSDNNNIECNPNDVNGLSDPTQMQEKYKEKQ